MKDPEIKEMWDFFAPMKNAHNLKVLKILVLNGRMDTRVNPHHSLNLLKALSTHDTDGDQVFMASIDKSGHFATKSSYTDHIGIYLSSVKWTMIYKQNHMKLKRLK